MSAPSKILRSTLLIAGLAAFSASPAFAICSTQGLELMKNLNGSWKGRGAVTPIGGAPERVSCRVSYSSESSSRINQTIECAGTDYKITATSRITCNGNRLEGSFTEKIGNNSGTISGSIDGSNLNIEADGPSFKGRFNVTFAGETKHSVTITQFDSAKGRHVPVAAVQLSR